jgi:hypothetical protein
MGRGLHGLSQILLTTTTTMSKVKALRSHLGAYPTSFYFQDQVTEGRISEVEIPHIFKGALIHNPRRPLARHRSTKWIPAIRNRWHFMDYIQSIMEKCLLGLIC